MQLNHKINRKISIAVASLFLLSTPVLSMDFEIVYKGGYVLLYPNFSKLPIQQPKIQESIKTVTREVEGEKENAVVLFPNLTPDVGGLILERAVKDRCYEFGFAGNIGSVCKAWDNFVNAERYTSPLYKNLKVGLQTKCLYDTFYNGELIYRPNPKTDEGMIRLKISDLANPSEGAFDLSLCGDNGQYWSISTGYRKGKIAENKNKAEIWFASREYIKKELKEGRAQQFKGIFPNWKPKAQVGIFWTWGNDDNLNWFDYLTREDNLTLCSKNLYENWEKRWQEGIGVWRRYHGSPVFWCVISCSF